MSVLSNRFSDAAADADAYTKAVLELLGDRDPLEVLAGTPDAIGTILADLHDASLQTPEAPGKWSITMVVRHLVDSDLVWANRLRKMVAEDEPRIAGFDQDLWADRLHYERERIGVVLPEFRAVRELNVRFLRELTDEELERRAVHSERGTETVAHMMRMYAGHDIAHLRQIERVRDAVA